MTADGSSYSAVVYPEAYGAVGDGVTDDTAALLAWVASRMSLALTPGKTYVHRQQLNIACFGQQLNGNGATLKRIAQVSATSSTTIASGATNQLTINGSSNPFEVGDGIVVSQGGATGTYDYPRQITAISGQQVTISGNFQVSLSGTTNVYLGGSQVYIGYDNCRVTNTVLDGNASNWTLTNWGVGVGIYVGPCNNALVDHNRLNNQIGDALETDNAVQAVFAFNDVENCAGRGFSFGASGADLDVGNKVIYNRFYNCETNPNAYISPQGLGNDGHGSVSFSNGGQDCLIHGNQIDTGIEGVGGLGNLTAIGATISFNVFRNLSSCAIEGTARGLPSAATHITIDNNRFYGISAGVLLQCSPSYSGDALGWTVTNNKFIETPLAVQNYQEIDISGNTFTSAGTTLTLITLDDQGGTAVNGVQRSTVCRNRCYGGGIAIDLGRYPQALIVSQNLCHNQLTAGVDASSSTNASLSTVVENNDIITGAATGASFSAIDVSGTITIRNNTLDCSLAPHYTFGIQLKAAASGCVVRGNTVKSGGVKVNTIYVNAGATNNIVCDNILDRMYSDLGTNTTKHGNAVSSGPSSGTAVLVAGTVTVSTAEVQTGDNILVTCITPSGTQGFLSYGTITAGASVKINSSSSADTSTVYWEIRH
ncbi:MAG: hypothetical protein ACLPZR_14795 [Solirubrobacteraceae bacterium]